MSWADTFYPDNPKRRTEVIQLCTKLYTLMGGNFKTTNTLIDTIKEHIPESNFEHISVNDRASIKDNCDIMINRINEIQTFLEKKNIDIKDKIDLKLYQQLMNVDVPLQSRIAIATQITQKVTKIGATVVGIVLITGITAGKILVTAVQSIGKCATCGLASLALGVLVMGIDMIASAILGALERDALEEKISNLEAALREFEPDADKYNIGILKVVAVIELMTDKPSVW